MRPAILASFPRTGENPGRRDRELQCTAAQRRTNPGPQTQGDFIGLDGCRGIMCVMHRGRGGPRFRSCKLRIKMDDVGWLANEPDRDSINVSYEPEN